MKLLQNTQNKEKHRHEGAWDNGQVENETKTHHITREEDTGGRRLNTDHESRKVELNTKHT